MTKSTPQVAKVDINGVIDEVLALTETELRMHSVVTFTDLAPKLAPVSGDRVQLQQVILNLVLNAIDAMASFSGRPRVLRIGSQLQTGGEVLISVRDSGPGLDPETAEKIFSPFFTTKEKGTGLGLPISRRIVENHGGTIEVRSQPGAGATFTVLLPAAGGLRRACPQVGRGRDADHRRLLRQPPGRDPRSGRGVQGTGSCLNLT